MSRSLDHCHKQCRLIEELAGRARRRVPDLLRRAERSGDKVKLPGGWSAERGGKGGHSDPTGSAATNLSADPMLVDARQAITKLREAKEALVDVLDLVNRHATSEAPKLPTPAGSGDCNACGRYCPGGPDRLRGGYCPACRMAWERAGRPVEHKAQWERERRERAHASSPETRRSTANPSEHFQTVSGRGVW